MYSNLLQPRVVPIHVESNSLKGANVSTIDALVTVDESGKRWSIALINRDPSKVVRCTLDLTGITLEGTYQAKVLTGDSPDSHNHIAQPTRVVPKDVRLIINKGTTELPPHSLTILDVLTESVYANKQCILV